MKKKILAPIGIGLSMLMLTTPVWATEITEKITPTIQVENTIETKEDKQENKTENETKKAKEIKEDKQKDTKEENKQDTENKDTVKENNNDTKDNINETKDNNNDNTNSEEKNKEVKERVNIPDTAIQKIIINTFTGDLENEREKRKEELEKLKTELTEIDKKLNELSNKASELNEKIFISKDNLKKAEVQEDKQSADMKLRIQYMYENKTEDSIFNLLTSKDMGEILNEIGYYQQIHDYDREKLGEYEENVNTIDNLKKGLESDLEEIKKIEEETKQEQEKINKLIEDKKQAISLLDDEILNVTNYVIQSQVLNGQTDTNAKVLLEIATKAQEKALKEGTATEKQVLVAKNAGNGISTFPPLYNWCAAWVSGVYGASGITPPHGNAIDYWTKWGYTGSRDYTNIPIGAAVISSGHPTYGHIGIYLGGGVVASNLGYVKIETIESFGSTTNVCQGYQGFVGWVWPNNIDLSK